MLQHIIRFSVRNKLIIGLFTLALVLSGVYAATQLPIDAVPDITNNQVQIITLTPTLAAQETEQLVTYPIEQSLANLPDLEEMRSISRFGLSVITVVFHDDIGRNPMFVYRNRTNKNRWLHHCFNDGVEFYIGIYFHFRSLWFSGNGNLWRRTGFCLL